MIPIGGQHHRARVCFWQPTKHLVEQFHHVFVQRIAFFRAVECDDCNVILYRNCEQL